MSVQNRRQPRPDEEALANAFVRSTAASGVSPAAANGRRVGLCPRGVTLAKTIGP